MNGKKSAVDSAMEDLKHIRSVLDGPAALRPLAPYFLSTGLVWLAYALLMTMITLPDMLSYLWPSVAAFQFAVFGGFTMLVYDWGKWVLWAFLLVQCGLWQWEKRRKAFGGMAQKVLTLWQLFLGLYLVFMVLLEVGLMRYQPSGVFLEETGATFVELCWILQYALPILFPAIPLLVTGLFLGGKELPFFGVVALLTAVACVVLMLFPMDGGGPVSMGRLSVSILVGEGMDYLQPVGLLLAAWRMGRKGD